MLVTVALNQRWAGAGERDVVAVEGDALDAALATFAALDAVDEVAVISTAHRVEVHAATRCPAAATLALRRALAARAGRGLPLLALQGADAFRHLVRTAASLDGATLREPSLLEKTGAAFQRAVEAGAAGRELASVAARALRAARRVRAESGFGRSGPSWGHAAAAFAEKVLGPLRGRTAAVVGSGELAREAARHLAQEGVSVAALDASPARAEALAREVGGAARPLEALGEALLQADLVISAAPAAAEAFAPARVAAAVRARRRRIVLVDLAVPAAIPAAAGALEDVYLCDVHGLERVLRASLEERRAGAERLVEQEVARWARDAAEGPGAPEAEAAGRHGAGALAAAAELLGAHRAGGRSAAPPR